MRDVSSNSFDRSLSDQFGTERGCPDYQRRFEGICDQPDTRRSAAATDHEWSVFRVHCIVQERWFDVEGVVARSGKLMVYATYNVVADRLDAAVKEQGDVESILATLKPNPTQ
jgi:hypothetical protein